jgi:hypothetical protein
VKRNASCDADGSGPRKLMRFSLIWIWCQFGGGCLWNRSIFGWCSKAVKWPFLLGKKHVFTKSIRHRNYFLSSPSLNLGNPYFFVSFMVLQCWSWAVFQPISGLILVHLLIELDINWASARRGHDDSWKFPIPVRWIYDFSGLLWLTYYPFVKKDFS